MTDGELALYDASFLLLLGRLASVSWRIANLQSFRNDAGTPLVDSPGLFCAVIDLDDEATPSPPLELRPLDMFPLSRELVRSSQL